MSVVVPEQPSVRLFLDLVWSEERKPDKDIQYDHVIAQTPFGRFVIIWKSWKDFDTRDVIETPWAENWFSSYFKLDEAKAACQEAYFKKLTECLTN